MSTVSIIIPTFNEEATLGGCINAVADQNYGAQNLQVLVIDSGSQDETLSVAAAAIERGGFDKASKVISNVGGNRSSNLNRGLALATGDLLCRVDARSRLKPDYVARCILLLLDNQDTVMVGGRQVATAADNGIRPRAIARTLNNRWAMGGATYRRATTAGPADTVYLGAFRTAQLRALEGWDTSLTANEDFDLAQRLSRLGAVWFDPKLTVGYVPRTQLREVVTQYFGFGRSKVVYWRRSSARPRPRQLGALIGLPLSIIGLVAALKSPKTRLVGLVAVIGTAYIVETKGADEPTASLPAHAMSATIIAMIPTAWTAGVWVELIKGRWRADDRT